MRPKISKSTQARPIVLDYARRRPVRSGSVMIMVVALLVLLSLIGMAYVATARSDRTGSAQNSVNVRADTMHFGIVELVKNALASGVFGPSNAVAQQDDYRPASPIAIPGNRFAHNYAHYDSPWHPLPVANSSYDDHRGDIWLADRVPDFAVSTINGSGGAKYLWHYISGPLGTNRWEDPVTLNSSWIPGTSHLDDAIIDITADGRYPGLRLDPVRPPITAVDNDDDGIADGLPFRLNVGPVDGLTWYASVRIIDNCAALNVAVAWKRIDNNANPFDSFYPALFPTNIELIKMLRSASFSSELNSLQAFRTGDSGLRTNAVPIDDSGVAHADFTFSPGLGNTGSTMAQWMQLGRRLDFPGLNFPNRPYQRFPVADTLGMAAGFVVQTPQTGQSITETTLFDALQTGASNSAPYQLTNADITAWGQNFLDSPFLSDPLYSRRPLMVTHNPVANVIQPHFYNTLNTTANPPTGDRFDVPTDDMLPYFPAGRFKGEWQPNFGPGYQIGDIVEIKGVSPSNNSSPAFAATFICVEVPATAGKTAPPLGQNNIWRKYWEYQPWTTVPVKASLNTATFRELYRAYFNVMCNDVRPLVDPQNTADHDNFSPFFDPRPNVPTFPQSNDTIYYQNGGVVPRHRMFRSSLRDNSATNSLITGLHFDTNNQLLLRAAIAAVNTIDLRDADHSITSRTIRLNASGVGAVDVTVYGCERQPFITEVYVNTLPLEDPTDLASKSNKHGFVAVELFNPYNFPIVINKGWELATINRHPKRVGNINDHNLTNIQSTPNSTFATPITIGPGKYVVLHNFKAGSANQYDAAFVPKQTIGGNLVPVWTSVANRDFYIPNLGKVIADIGRSGTDGYELVILRPRNEDGLLHSTANAGSPSYDSYDESAHLSDLVPVDQFDFTGIKVPNPINLLTEEASVTHYIRENDSVATGAKRWKCVYPGRYSGDIARSDKSRHEQAQVILWDAVAKDPNDPTKVVGHIEPSKTLIRPVKLGDTDDLANYNANTNPSQPDFPQGIKLFDSADDLGGTFPRATNNHYPFGGFAQLGDIYKVPFIGAYRVRLPSQPVGVFLELNSISMDSAFADDADDASANNDQENIGRFVLLGDPASGNNDYAANEETPNLAAGGTVASVRYLWAHDLLDYFTVIAPNDAYFADADGNPVPDLNKTTLNNRGTVGYRFHIAQSATTGYYQDIKNGNLSGQPQPVLNKDYASGERTRDVPVVEGLININTAPWRVLATLPMSFGPNGASVTDYRAQAKLAHEIVDYRNVHGPFKSISDLNKVSGFARALGRYTQAKVAPIDKSWEEKTETLSRISNLITTRSDSFTAYITIQGWKNAGGGGLNGVPPATIKGLSGPAELMVQRRLIVVFDRSGVIYTTDYDPTVGGSNALPGHIVRDIKAMIMPQD